MSQGAEGNYSTMQQFQCEAIPAPGVPVRATPSTWNAGNPILVVHDEVARPPQADLQHRQSQLRQFDCVQLRELVEQNAAQLSVEDLLIVQRIAHERATMNGSAEREAAALLEEIVARIVIDRPQ